MDEYRKKRTKVLWITAAVIGAAAVICAKTRKIQRKARREGRHVPYGSYEAVLKRPLDVLVVTAALPVVVPVVGITALAVRVKLGSPVLFRQERPGKDEKIFTLYKFRTMTEERDKDGELLPDARRLTGFGKWLRSTSLDELPELFNVLKGDMSLVGPRPLLVEYLPRYDERQKKRHDVRPGLTGLAQVSGRNRLSWEEKFADDVRYVQKIVFWGDLKIVWNTVRTVLGRKGINSGTSATMEVFTGSEGIL